MLEDLLHVSQLQAQRQLQRYQSRGRYHRRRQDYQERKLKCNTLPMQNCRSKW